MLFLLLLLFLKNVDVQPVGPEGSLVGFAGINSSFHNMFGYQAWLYKATGYAGYLALLVAAGFGLYGIIQLIRRKHLSEVDPDLFLLAGLYVVVLVLYVLFEKIVINYRPVILEDGLEASFPSSHTMMAICILVPAMEQFRRRLRSPWRTPAVILSGILLAVIVLGRLLSGVHWLTDILASILLSTGLVLLYQSFVDDVT